MTDLPEGRKPITTMDSADLVLRMHKKLAAGFSKGDRIAELEEMVEACKADAREAEAYAVELEAKLVRCGRYRDAYAECDKLASDRIEQLEAVLRDVDAWVDDLLPYAQEGHEPANVFKRVKEVLNK